MTITSSTPPQGLSEAAWENFALDQLGEPLGWRPLAGGRARRHLPIAECQYIAVCSNY